jgi:glucose-1-phosphate adenylyltransferase
MDGVEVGRHCKIRRTIVDKGVKIPAGVSIGYDLEADRERFTVTDSGIVVVSKGAHVEEKVIV